MKNHNKQKINANVKTHIFIAVSICLISAVFFILSAFGSLEKFEAKFYDILLGFKKTPVEREEIMLLDIDDIALNYVGEWPWKRSVMGDALLYLRELGTEKIVFDIEYLSPSQKTTDFALYNDLVKNGEANKSELEKLVFDNDDYLSRAIQFFPGSWLTINSGNLAIDYSEEEIDYAKKRFLYDGLDEDGWLGKTRLKKTYYDFSPCMNEFISHAKGAGFTNVTLDSDGTRRRVPLLVEYEDGFLAQLAFSPLLKTVNPQKIKIKKQKIILENCTIDGNIKTVSIPLDKNGNMLINWLKKPYADETLDKEKTSFSHCSFFYVWQLSELEKSFEKSLLYFSKNSERNNENQMALDVSLLLDGFSDIQEYKSFILQNMNGFDDEGNSINGGIDDGIFNEYFSLRESFFNNLYDFSNGEDFINEVNFALDNGNNDFVSEASSFSENIELFVSYFYEMKKMFAQKICFVGNTGSGTTDIGSTPFQNAYPNLGTHANVYNTILTESFITPVDWKIGAIVSVILSFVLFVFVSAKQKVSSQTATGAAFIVATVLIPILLMHFFSLYVPIASAFLISVCSFIFATVANFRLFEKDKKFITGAFSQCLSKDVVNEIIKDPSKLSLGGKNFEMTAIFTDIQKFSSFSELLSAEQLVALLNYYLTKMSEIIIAEHGTVDKYEGDAIVAFTGAPIQMIDHAKRACAAALKMKKAEIEINKNIKKIAALNEKPDDIEDSLFSAFKILVSNDKTIFTRIGLNSGDIVAGFMGSENKKNYTVMGNNVNLASRLEGVNKQYRTGGILLSEETRKGLDEQFVVRSLDRVQVVNVKTPIRLYELVAFKEDCDDDFLKYISDWENAIKLFESEKYSDSLSVFNKLSSIRPDDNVCSYYIFLLENFFIKGTYPTSQDNIGVSYNAENPKDMDSSWLGTEKEIKGTFTLLQK